MIAPMSARPFPRLATLAVVLAGAVLLAAGCGDDSTDAAATTDTVATATQQTATSG